MNTTQKHPTIVGETAKVRRSNLELYRILTMILIVAHHYVVNSGLNGPISTDPTSWRSIFLLVFGAFGKTGINCFVLITGYFMCKSQITLKKFCKLVFEVEFYKIAFWFVFLLSGYAPFSLEEFVKTIIPIRSINSGFISCYLLFFLFIPFINILIKNISEIQHIKLLILCTFMYIIIGTVSKFGITMNYVSWFIVLYLFGAYISIYDRAIFSNTKFWGCCSLAALIISMMSVVVMTWVGTKLNRGSSLAYFFVSDSNKVLAVILSLCSFLYFKNINIRNSKFINTVSASTFGVLLIHANSDTMRQWLWKDTLNNVGMYNSNGMVLHAVGSVLIIYAVCTIIDCLRIRFIEIPFFKMLDKFFNAISRRYVEFEDKVCEKLK